MTTHEILKAARARIEKPENWGKGDLQGETLCAGIAIDLEARNAGLNARICEEAFEKHAGIKQHIVAWNDAPERTHQDILDAFDRAIAATAQ